MPPGCLIVGSLDDLHVQAVCRALHEQRAYVVDAASLITSSYLMTGAMLELGDGDQRFRGEPGTRGWIRRLAPPGWGSGTVLGSKPAAAQAAAVSLLAAMTRTAGVRWLTDLDPLLIGESKLGQIAAAAGLGIATPKTVVTNRLEAAQSELGDDVVIKPLGPGHFLTGDEASVVYAQQVDLRDPRFADFGDTPFLFQQRLEACRHLRVVTVDDQVWVAALSAEDLPLDWRSNAAAHGSFAYVVDPPDDVVASALSMTQHLRLGSSSQDWVLTADGPYLLDVNPAGQWLFLPEPIPSGVTAAIAAWLSDAAGR